MTGASANTATGRAMTSPVYWALLGLVIARPSYGNELYQRFQRLYADVLPISSHSHIYAGLDVLQARGLIAPILGVDALSRQPKPHYQATQSGVESYVEWLVQQVDAERRRQELWVRQLAVFAHNPGAALDVLGRFEHQYLKDAGQIGRQPAEGATGSRDELIDELVARQQRIAAGGMLALLRYAHDTFEARAGSAARDDSPRA
jgi:DNA-binding PadR family transcriptional regulator